MSPHRGRRSRPSHHGGRFPPVRHDPQDDKENVAPPVNQARTGKASMRISTRTVSGPHKPHRRPLKQQHRNPGSGREFCKAAAQDVVCQAQDTNHSHQFSYMESTTRDGHIGLAAEFVIYDDNDQAALAPAFQKLSLDEPCGVFRDDTAMHRGVDENTSEAKIQVFSDSDIKAPLKALSYAEAFAMRPRVRKADAEARGKGSPLRMEVYVE
ncbi:hypothetical protein D7B24_006258 [Verticillium nonalfalfae]|uniref:Uncharacterized protein n=1 Tax=Verticillium nonalfalfae TaxID=1051616 RepID=A0A3M9YA28_9PEZI|nr:uncharacterized protein D7B24_006258 [Verticillium nonalfalfae]RNJ57224.1 hypothetical protein D7B24_006258 [Verticillium nonalfalfae]